LAKTYYNVKGHQPESLDWFNVLVAQTIAQLRADARHDDAVLTSLTEVLNNGSKPDWIGEIRVTEIALGDEFPIFSNCRVMPAEDGFGVGVGSSGGDDGRLQARMDVDLSDVITLGIETTLVLNYPKPLVAVLPVALAVSVVRFSGTLAVSFIPSSTPSASSSNPHPNKAQAADPPSHPSTSSSSTPSRPTSLAFTFLDDYRLDLSVRSLVGSRSRLQDVPKIAQLIESRVHAWFDERVVEPRFQQIVLPSLWPRKRNTRGGEDEENLPSTVPAASSISLGLNEDSSAVVDDEAEASQTETETDGLRIKSATAPTTRNKPANTPSALEARMAAEGAKLREAETRAGERSRAEESAGIRRRGEQQRFGDRLHRSDASRPTLPSRFSGEWSGQRGMPGAMPGG
jgi:maintenance of morphology protein 1